MNRRRPEFQAIDVGTWPTVAFTELDEGMRRTFERRQEAVVRYAAGESIKSIEEMTGVDRRQLYRWLERALALHPDGRPFGFRAFIRYEHISVYERVRKVQVLGERGSRGTAGALSQLFERYPELAGWLRLQVRQRKVQLEQAPSEGRIRIRLRGLQALHDGFLRQCRAVGLTAADYPFNTATRAMGSLSRRVKAEVLRVFGTAARSAGATHVKGLPNRDKVGAPAATRPYQVVEFDGHRLDVRLKVVVRDPLGFEHEFEIERVWLLVIIDACSRAVLGYHVALASEYSRYDVIKTIEKALEPHQPRLFTIPGLAYGRQDGLPSQCLPELAYVTWEWMKLDNARANLADETLKALCEFVGCCVDAGPRHSPDERPYIERFFGTIASRLSSRLPGYTGTSPRDLRRTLADPKGDMRLFVSLDELDELLEYAIASYNGTSHSGLNNATPLEAMTYFVRGKQTLVTWLPEERRRTLCLMQSARRCRVRSYIEQGVRPHINLHGVRYTNAVLASSAHLIGGDLLVYMNADDLRCVRAFLSDGAELGTLEAQGVWRVFPHSLKLRQEILKGRCKRSSKSGAAADPVEGYVLEKLARAGKSRKAATQLARAVRSRVSAPPTTDATDLPRVVASRITPASTVGELEVQVPVSVGNPVPHLPARPRKLSIGSGQVF